MTSITADDYSKGNYRVTSDQPEIIFIPLQELELEGWMEQNPQ